MKNHRQPAAKFSFPRFFWILALLFGLAMVIPYLWAYGAWKGEFVFGGFLFNPMDGNSYLAKMFQGWQGNWKFTLPYTAQPGEGTYLFLFYLFLGHMARWTHLELDLAFHAARLISSIAMLLALWHFFQATIADARCQKIAFALSIFGAGLGWLGIFFGTLAADLWVAEAYPFLAAYANPHFPLGIALVAWLLTPEIRQANGQPSNKLARRVLALPAAALLSIVLPFGVIIVGIVLAGMVAWQAGEQRRFSRSATSDRLLAVSLGSAPFLLYELWVISAHASLRAWNSQNLTPSPPFWNFLLAFLPALLLVIPGAIEIVRGDPAQGRVLLAWALAGVALLYLPVGTQRRLMLGLLVPIAGLAAMGIGRLTRRNQHRAWVWAVLAMMLSMPTVMLVLMAGLHGVRTHDGLFYLQPSEYRALQWISGYTLPDALILASPEMGMYIPAQTGRKVIYGHPFETIQAEKAKAQVIGFYRDNASAAFVASLPVDYILVGPRERQLGEPHFLDRLLPVYQDGDVGLFRFAP